MGRAPGVGDQSEGGQVGAAVAVPVREEPLEVGGDAEHRGGPLALDGGRHQPRLEGSRHDDTTAGEGRAAREAQGRGVVERAEHQVDVVGPEAPEVALLLDQRLSVGGVQHAAPHALGCPGRAAGDVHRPRPRQAEVAARTARAASVSTTRWGRGCRGPARARTPSGGGPAGSAPRRAPARTGRPRGRSASRVRAGRPGRPHAARRPRGQPTRRR